MDSPGTEQNENGVKSSRQNAAGTFSRRFVLGAFVFWVVVIVGFVIFRYPFIFSKLVGGGEDRPLLAIVSAELNNNTLNIEFIRSMPDQPAGVFVAGGHIPKMAMRTSNSQLENSLSSNSITINGQTFEIIFEAADPSRLPGRTEGMEIGWADNEHGHISLDLEGTYALEEIRANRAFVVVARDTSDFRAASIMFD